MRLARLDLTRFGKFTDRSVDLPASGSDLHVIYGPNEAGKSTLRQALLDLLYGIHPRTAYDFKHGYATMELGGTLEDPVHGTLALKRFKRNKNALQTAAGQPLTEADLARWLANTNRESFERMFAIDHTKLVAGGESIMSADGDFGRMLFEAAAGVGNLAELRKQIEAEADDLWGQRKRKDHQYTQAEEQFTTAKNKLAEVSLTTGQWKAAQSALATAVAAEDAADAELARHATRQRQLERVKRVATPLQRFRLATAARLELGTPAAFPDGADTTFDAAEATLATASTSREHLTEGLETDQTALAAINLRPALSRNEAAITDLAGRRALYQRAEIDLPGVRKELEAGLAALAAATRGLGWPETALDAIAAKLPSPLVRADLAAHLKLLSDLSHDLDSARRDLVAKQDAIKVLEDQLATAPDATELPSLARALTDAVALNYAEAFEKATAAVESAALKTAECFNAVHPNQGTLADLLVNSRPTTAEVTGLTEERLRLTTSLQAATDQVERETTAVTLAESALTAHSQGRVLVTTEALQTQRGLRDTLWQALRQGKTPLAQGGDPYEHEVRAADALADVRYDDASHVAKAAELHNTVATRIIERDGTRQRLDRVAAELTQLNERWTVRVTQACGVLIPLEQYPAWSTARDAVLTAHRTQQDAERSLAALIVRAERVAAQLRTALATAAAPCPETDFGLLVAHATQVQTDRAESRLLQKGWRTTLRQHQTTLPDLSRAVADAEVALAAWQGRRDALMQSAGIPVATGTAGAERALEVLAEVEQTARATTALAKRVTAMEAEVVSFAAEAETLVAACAPELVGLPASDSVIQLDALARSEEQVATEHARLTKALGDTESKLETLAATSAAALATVAPLLATAKVSTMDDLREVVQQWRDCRAAEDHLQDLRDAVLNNGDGLALDALEAEVAAEDLLELDSELNAVTRRVTEIEAKRKSAVEARTKAQEAFGQYAGQDSAVRAEAARQDALLLMREAADGHFKLALSAKLLAWATNKYAESKHEPLLRSASNLFQRLTLGSFERLAVGHDADGAMTLYAYRPDGSFLPIGKGLSTGSEAQLYLALRIASIQQHLATGSVLPFLGDDLLLGFDKARCAACLDVLADLSTQTQVVLLTHDEGIADIARGMPTGRATVTVLG